MVVIVTKAETPTMPCGACRQVMNEFGDDILVYSFTTDGKSVQFTSKQLLPEAFGPVPESR
jgi:cytidine deaminase